MRSTMYTSLVRTADGLAMPYVERGDAHGTPVLLIHGLTDSWKSFAPVLPHLPARLRSIALTLRGHGDADRPAEGYRLHDMAADVAAFMDRLHLRSAIIVGHSMGSAVAQRFALDYPVRTAGLVVAGSFPTAVGNPSLAALWEEVRTLSDPVPREFAFEFQRSTVAQPVPDGLLDAMTDESLKVPARVWQAALNGMMDADHSTQLGRITAPTMVMWGSKDAFFLRHDQERLLTLIPRARLRVYGGAGHALHWEEPQRFAADLAEFAAGAYSTPLAA